MVLFATPRTNLLAATEAVSSWEKVWFLSVLFTINKYLPDEPLASPVIVLAVDPVSLNSAPEDML